MNPLEAQISEDAFHADIHESVGETRVKYAFNGVGKNRRRLAVDKAHRCEWASTTVNLKSLQATIKVHLNIKTNISSEEKRNQLTGLIKAGISEYWSRPVKIKNRTLAVYVDVLTRPQQSIPVNLKIEKSEAYARSHNSGILPATLSYNEGFYKTNTIRADKQFKLTAAHEFGHSVLEYTGGKLHSWGHKGSSHALLQTPNAKAESYPETGEIDLMLYYRNEMQKISWLEIENRTRASEQDVKRLIWLSQLRFN